MKREHLRLSSRAHTGNRRSFESPLTTQDTESRRDRGDRKGRREELRGSRRAASKEPTVHRRNSSATREAILRSARKAFARQGYDGAGLREIARGAGVTAMMVNRYFGSKERLFAEVIASTMAEPIILTPKNLASRHLAKTIASMLVNITKTGDTPLDGFLIMLRSASSKCAARIGRRQLERGHQKTMTDALRGEFAAERAALILSVVAGFQVMRQMIGLKALAESEPDRLVQLLEPLFQKLIDP